MNDFMNSVTNSKAVRLALIAVLVLLALFLLVRTVDTFDELGRSSSPMMNTITVNGEGRAAAVPDIARVTYSVMETDTNVAAAQEKATVRSNSALEALKELEIDEDDIRTVSYNVSPQYNYNDRICPLGYPCGGSPTITGYQVMQMVEVKVRDTAKASEVLAKLGELGVQNINGPEFALDDPAQVKTEAREEAITKAREEAERLAKQLGVRLGKVVSFYDNNQGPMYGYGGGAMDGMKEMAVQSAPTLPVGQNEYTANVSITYEIR
ncbi:MAG TPA: SIMPL domain-containing protein [Candidatus Paceibacterota bacterium]|nr:SIMPL domain-containing protein [Candidatus Paceibacterota bacterium]